MSNISWKISFSFLRAHICIQKERENPDIFTFIHTCIAAHTKAVLKGSNFHLIFLILFFFIFFLVFFCHINICALLVVQLSPNVVNMKMHHFLFMDFFTVLIFLEAYFYFWQSWWFQIFFHICERLCTLLIYICKYVCKSFLATCIRC